MEHTKIFIMRKTSIYYLTLDDKIPFYVGKTIIKLKDRLRKHQKERENKNIKIHLIEEIPTEEWKFWEKYWIFQFKCWGFELDNKNNGGGGLTEWTLEMWKYSPIRSKKISKANKGMESPNKGKKLSKEHKEKIKETRGFLKGRPNTWQSKSVLQYDLDGNFIREFASQNEASKFIGTQGDGVGACCRGRQNQAYGYIWKFKK